MFYGVLLAVGFLVLAVDTVAVAVEIGKGRSNLCTVSRHWLEGSTGVLAEDNGALAVGTGGLAVGSGVLARGTVC
jgi:hypothetical protein